MRNLIPRFIKKNYQDKKLWGKFNALVMFVDFLGFTKLSEKFRTQGKLGVENLTQAMNSIFDPAIGSVYANGGFISSFAGDAFTAVFPDLDNPNHMVNCSLDILKIFHQNPDLSAKIGLSAGEVSWKIIEHSIQNSYYFYGPGIDRVVESSLKARREEVIVDHYIQDYLTGLELNPIDHDYSSLTGNDIIEIQPTRVEIPPDIPDQKCWLPEILIKSKITGEFRDIISAFIIVDEVKNFDDFISSAISLSYKYGGYFNKVDYGDKGKIILILFGAPAGIEKMFARAGDFALELTENEPVKVGLTYGTAFCGFIGGEIRGEYTAIGTVVNLSARLAQSAQQPEIRIDENIARKIFSSYQLSDGESGKLKGFSGKIKYFQLQDKRRIVKQDQFKTLLVGRKSEVEKINNWLKDLKTSGFKKILSVVGEAGIGKTRLIEEVKHRQEEKFEWLEMSCEEILQKPFNPLVSGLNNYFNLNPARNLTDVRIKYEQKYNNLLNWLKASDHPDSEDLFEELSRTRSVIGALFNLQWTDSLYDKLDAQGRYENTQFGLKALLKTISLISPLVIHIDDVHWIDQESLDFLKFLTTNIDGYPMAIIASYRPTGKADKFESELKSLIEININLGILNHDSVVELTEVIIKNRLDLDTEIELKSEIINRITNQSEGNPFYVEQIILYLIENNYIPGDQKINRDKLSGEFEIPSSINQIIISRIDKLASDLKEVVKTAAVLGREFEVDILSGIFKKLNQSYNIEYALNQVERENIWQAIMEMRYIFKHALIRESVYQMQLKSQLKKIHGIAAEIIEQLHNDESTYYYDLANHFEKSENMDKTIYYLKKSAEYFTGSYQNSLALLVYDKLLSIFQTLTEQEELIKFILKKNLLLKVAGDYKQAEQEYLKVIELCRQINNSGLLAESYSYYAWILVLIGKTNQAVDYYQLARQIYENENNIQGISDVLGGLGNAYSMAADYDKAMEYYNEKLKIDREHNNRLGLAKTIGNIGIIHYYKKDNENAVNNYQESLKYYRELNDVWSSSKMLGNLGVIFSEQGKFQKALDNYYQALNIKNELGDKRGISTIKGNIGNLYQYQGLYSQAVDYYLQSIKIKEELGDIRGICIVAGNLGLTCALMNDFEKSIQAFDYSIKSGKINKLNYFLCNSMFRKAEVLYDNNNFQQAEILNEEAGKIAEDIKREDVLFETKILKLKLQYRMTKNSKKRKDITEKLKSCLEIYVKKQQHARIYHELAVFTKNPDYKKKAIELWDEVYKQTSEYRFKIYIKQFN
ncbi:MAG: hypothetical protein APR63_13890 [Desulfuromonas sp. SDB]|nr:MAG: hypothetical protein APR63_13890 [Desulfuromonas sp. SDB]